MLFEKPLVKTHASPFLKLSNNFCVAAGKGWKHVSGGRFGQWKFSPKKTGTVKGLPIFKGHLVFQEPELRDFGEVPLINHHLG